MILFTWLHNRLDCKINVFKLIQRVSFRKTFMRWKDIIIISNLDDLYNTRSLDIKLKYTNIIFVLPLVIFKVYLSFIKYIMNLSCFLLTYIQSNPSIELASSDRIKINIKYDKIWLIYFIYFSTTMLPLDWREGFTCNIYLEGNNFD